MWTGAASCEASSCTNKCIANLYPAYVASPVLSEVAYQNDAYYGICPELALMVDHTRADFYALGLGGGRGTTPGASLFVPLTFISWCSR
jgi:hypothetical protein